MFGVLLAPLSCRAESLSAVTVMIGSAGVAAVQLSTSTSRLPSRRPRPRRCSCRLPVATSGRAGAHPDLSVGRRPRVGPVGPVSRLALRDREVELRVGGATDVGDVGLAPGRTGGDGTDADRRRCPGAAGCASCALGASRALRALLIPGERSGALAASGVGRHCQSARPAVDAHADHTITGRGERVATPREQRNNDDADRQVSELDLKRHPGPRVVVVEGGGVRLTEDTRCQGSPRSPCQRCASRRWSLRAAMSHC